MEERKRQRLAKKAERAAQKAREVEARRAAVKAKIAESKEQRKKGDDAWYDAVGHRASEFNGVSASRKARQFVATHRRVHLGSFNDPEEAARAYDDAARAVGQTKGLNFATAEEIAQEAKKEQQPKPKRKKTSKYRGVAKNRKSGKFEAAFGPHRLGHFPTEREAGIAYDNAALAAGHFQINHASVQNEDERQRLLAIDRERVKAERAAKKEQKRKAGYDWFERNKHIVSKYIGVFAHRHKCKFEATYRGKYMGSFSDPEEAARAYDEAARASGETHQKLNFPDS
ncbi:Pathogenesis-related transcriptional factor and ERF, DNA-binding domain protein [Rhodopirellula maiorica SM1]|uniref:Pathogenesis-related transcriptional factor and ERF, DNA-binding domain protein n=1 Tax=Rhodopirellula maiorica SM1 TaxID=1265738 RepID=M5RPI4_9BACT|nr:Pathogenesis-related transcriptional factor and ERF, DNA-binding domain protein [Rhodopirellula maiorica SM1]